MMKASRFIFVPVALGIIGMASITIAQEPVQLKFSRVVDLTLPIETNMAARRTRAADDDAGDRIS